MSKTPVNFRFDASDKLASVKKLLEIIGMPKQQQNDMCCYSLLALLKLKTDDRWSIATNNWIRIHDMIEFINNNYGTSYAENTRESIRKQAMHHFRNAAIIEDNGKPTNSPAYRYRVTEEFLSVIRRLEKGNRLLMQFMDSHDSLIEQYASKKIVQRMPVKINNSDFTFSPGEHNELQKAILEEFAPRFAHNCECLYVGDSDIRDLYKNVEKLSELGFEITLHDKMPDVVLYCEEVNWIYFVESVTNVGPMDPKRVKEIQDMTQNVTAGKIYVTAFLSKQHKAFKKFYMNLAWETEVWLADEPDHMIHLNGNKFMGPHLENQKS